MRFGKPEPETTTLASVMVDPLEMVTPAWANNQRREQDKVRCVKWPNVV